MLSAVLVTVSGTELSSVLMVLVSVVSASACMLVIAWALPLVPRRLCLTLTSRL